MVFQQIQLLPEFFVLHQSYTFISITSASETHSVSHFGKIACEISFSMVAVYIFHLANKFALPLIAFVNFLIFNFWQITRG